MDQRDLEFLDKQLRGLSPQRNDGIMVLMVVAMFFAGMALGRILFAHESEPMPSCCR